jgi:putative FmdB family regulatory protein
MPIYEFVCQECDHEFEKILSFSSAGFPACPSCGAAQVVRRLGRPAIHFKGSGWYITDSKGGKNSANGKENGHESASSPVESEGKKAEDGKKAEGSKTESRQTKKSKTSE